MYQGRGCRSSVPRQLKGGEGVMGIVKGGATKMCGAHRDMQWWHLNIRKAETEALRRRQ